MDRPKTRYARSGDLSIAFQVSGEGPRDLLIVPGFYSHVEMLWESPAAVRFHERLMSFARVIHFDKRGTGLSDPVGEVPTLEERMDDIRAVLDAAGSERAFVFGISEGAPTSILFSTAYPDRSAGLILYGGMARSVEAPDYPWAPPADAAIQSTTELLMPFVEEGSMLEVFAPSIADDPAAREYAARYMRYAATPSMMQKIFLMFLDIDVRDVLPAVRVPTLVLHRRGDRVVNRRAGEWLASQIRGARFVELPGSDHMIYAGDMDAILDEVEEFITGVRGGAEPDRVLATVMFTDIVGSTERAAEMGDKGWRDLLDRHNAAMRGQLGRFSGREIKTMGDGFLAVFDGPARAIRCGLAIVDELATLGIDVRVGLHTGECERMGDDLGGIAVHIAARVGALAGVREVLVSGTVKDLVVGSGIAFADRGAHTLKGIPDEWRLYAVDA